MNSINDLYPIIYQRNEPIGFGEKVISFGGMEVNFPFDVESLSLLLLDLRERLMDRPVNPVLLQSYPTEIFNDRNFSQRPDLAGYVFNIIYAFVTDAMTEIQNVQKGGIFVNFLSMCEAKARRLIAIHGAGDGKEKGLTKEPLSVNQVANELTAKDMITFGLWERFTTIEEARKAEIEYWKEGHHGAKIACASWVELLYESKYLTHEKDRGRPGTCKAFALARYGVDISHTILSKCKDDRKPHKQLMKKWFNV